MRWAKLSFLNHFLMVIVFTKVNINGYYKQRYSTIWLAFDNSLNTMLFPIGNFNYIYALL
jgi:hypothetical protein